jgi:hypothetical protein
MALAYSKVTKKGQISVPAAIKPMRYSFEDMRKKLFGDKPVEPHTLEELSEGIAQYIRKTHGHR